MNACKCGHNDFYFIGVQTLPFDPFFLRLYNCRNCRTTVSTKAPRDEIPRTKAISGVTVSPTQTFETKQILKVF